MAALIPHLFCVYLGKVEVVFVLFHFRSSGCLFVFVRSVEWVIFTLGHSGLLAWFSVGMRKNFGMQTRDAVCGWGPARVSNRASLLKVLCSLHISPLHPWHYQWQLVSGTINYYSGVWRWAFCSTNQQHWA